LADLDLGLEALAEEVDLEVKAPARHVLVERVQVWVLDHRLVVRRPAELGGDPVRELRLADADVARDREEESGIHHEGPASSSSPSSGRSGRRNFARSS